MVRAIAASSFVAVLLLLFAAQVSAAVNTSGLVNSYNFVTGNNSVAPDNLSRNNFDVSAVTQRNPYPNIGEYVFDSDSTNHEMNTNSTIDVSLRGTNERTFIIWFNASRTTGNANYIFSSGSPTTNSHFAVYLRGAANTQTMTISEGIGEYGNIQPPRNYTFIAAVYNGSALRLYVNGSLDTTQAATSLNTPSSKLKLGDRIDGSNEQYNGTLISVFLYNRTLSATEIEEWYNKSAHFNPFATEETPPTPEPDIWNLSGKNVFVTNTSRDVAIGATVPSQRLHVNGSANITGTAYVGRLGINRPDPTHDVHIGVATYSHLDAGEVQFTTSSSREYKQNIVPVRIKVLEKIARIPVNTYDFKPEYCGALQSCTDKLGLIAEDFHTIFGRGSEKELNGQEVQMALWLAVQELHEEVTALKAQVASLEAQNAFLKEALCDLNSEVGFC